MLPAYAKQNGRMQGFHSYALCTTPSPASSSILILCKGRPYLAPIACMGIRNEDVQRRTDTESALGSCSHDTWSSVSSFLEGVQGGHADSSESLLGFSASLFSDTDAFVMEKEDPPEYIPAPVQSIADMKLSKQLENVLYILREVLPGPICKTRIDDKLLEAWRLMHGDIKVQDPLMCLHGKDKLWTWLHMLASANAQVDLHGIYAEKSIASKHCIYAVWTLTIPRDLQSTAKPSIFEGVEEQLSKLSLSGESKFDVGGTGQVVSIESDWYVPKGGEEMLESVKNYLALLLHKEMHD